MKMLSLQDYKDRQRRTAKNQAAALSGTVQMRKAVRLTTGYQALYTMNSFNPCVISWKQGVPTPMGQLKTLRLLRLICLLYPQDLLNLKPTHFSQCHVATLIMEAAWKGCE